MIFARRVPGKSQDSYNIKIVLQNNLSLVNSKVLKQTRNSFSAIKGRPDLNPAISCRPSMQILPLRTGTMQLKPEIIDLL